MKHKIICLVILIFICSCERSMDFEDLGSGYIFERNQILFTLDKKYNGSGFIVVPSKIDSIGYDGKCIVIASRNNFGNTLYWIILKNETKRPLNYCENNSKMNGYQRYSNVLGPLKRTEFNRIKSELKISADLKFENVDH